MGQLHHVRESENDQRLKDEISRLLNDQHFPSFKRLDVEVDHGLVTISGMLSSYHHRQVALSTCQQITDVITVIDMISVRDSQTPESSLASDSGQQQNGCS
jgi:osmotically-inducible protein OsmY